MLIALPVLTFVVTSGLDSMSMRVLLSLGSLLFVFLFGLFFTGLILMASLKGGAAKTTLTEHTVTLTEESVIETTAFNRNEQKWSGIIKVDRTRHYLFIFVSPYSGHVIPRRAFATVAEEEVFYNEVQARQKAASVA